MMATVASAAINLTSRTAFSRKCYFHHFWESELHF